MLLSPRLAEIAEEADCRWSPVTNRAAAPFAILAILALTGCSANQSDVTACELVQPGYERMNFGLEIGDMQIIESGERSLLDSLDLAADRADDAELIRGFTTASDALSRYSITDDDDSLMLFFITMGTTSQHCGDEHGVEFDLHEFTD